MSSLTNDFSSPFLGTFFQFAEKPIKIGEHDGSFSSPFLGTFFQFPQHRFLYIFLPINFSSPFLGTFFQSLRRLAGRRSRSIFRPLSWGLSFNSLVSSKRGGISMKIFVPFLGDFLSIRYHFVVYDCRTGLFSSPFLGTFFQLGMTMMTTRNRNRRFSSPFLGTFFQF